MPAGLAAAGITAGASLLGGLFGSPDPPRDPSAKWFKKHGSGILSDLKDQGYNLMDNPYGLGDSKQHMMNVARDTATAGYGDALRQRQQSNAIAGLNPSGGSAARMDYYAGRQMAEGLNRTYSQIEMADFQARESQIARGENILAAITNKNPIYSQMASQNYWNQLNYENDFNQSIGQSIGATYQNYLAGQGSGTTVNVGNPYDYLIGTDPALYGTSDPGVSNPYGTSERD